MVQNDQDVLFFDVTEWVLLCVTLLTLE